MTLLVQGASCSIYTCHSIHTWSYFTWSSVLLLLLVSYLSVYITVRFIIYSFPVLYLYYPLLSHFHIIVSFSRMCTCWFASNGPWFFSIRAWGDRRATIRRNPGRLLGVSLTFLISCILAFCLVMMSRCQNCIFFIPTLLCFKSCSQIKTIVDVYLLCENEISGYLFVYMCENLAHLLQRKVFTGEISLFVSIWWPSSRTRIPYFGNRVWHPG